MKILISHDSGAHFFDRLGWQKILNYCGHNCYLWQINSKSSHDIFNEFTPDLFIGQLHNIDRALYKCLLKYKPITILKAGHWGSLEIDTEIYPVLVASDAHKEIAQNLVNAGILKFVFVHYHQNRIPETMGHWNQIVEPVGLMNACDTFSYLGGEVKEEFKSDLAIISGYWGYKAKNLNKYIVPLCYPVGKYNIKIYGNSHWPVGQYVGPIQEENSRHVFRSTKINLDCHEPHYKFGFDVTERIFKVIGAGGFYLSGGYVDSVHKDVFPELGIRYVDKPEDFENVINQILELSQEKRDEIVQLQQKKILESETYFDRVAQAFSKLGIDNNILEKKNEHLATY